MTIAIVLADMIVADSRLCGGIGERPLTVGKIFHRKGGGIFTTTGDSRRTAHFEKAMLYLAYPRTNWFVNCSRSEF